MKRRRPFSDCARWLVAGAGGCGSVAVAVAIVIGTVGWGTLVLRSRREYLGLFRARLQEGSLPARGEIRDLDLESVAALADAVEAFQGGVVLVSHDQYFVGRVAKEVWLVAKGGVKKVESFDKYREYQLKKLAAPVDVS